MSKAPPKKKEPSLSKASLSDRQTAAASLLASSLESFGAAWGCKFPIWPEWNDEEVNKEKWDSSKGADEGKTNKSPNAPFFEEPEGKISLPPSLNVHSWKRPTEFIVNKSPVIVESQMTFDLISANDHLICNELMRWIISDICTVSTLCNKTSTVQDGWKPWDHIYSLCRAEKGHMPLYNSYGKYLVRLYWMGSWRKITVDDCMPFDEENNLLLPASTCQTELWPMLLAKALIKVANTNELSEVCGEMGEFTFIHTLTGWIPEFRPVNSGDLGKIWDFLQDTIPIFALPEESLPEIEPVTPVSGKGSSLKDDKSRLPEQENSTSEVVVCASCYPFQPQNNSSGFGLMANSAEVLRQYSLSLLYSHITLVTRTRSCQLEAPPQPAPVPQWKLIRPPKEIVVTAEPREPPLSKPEQFIEVASPFLSYRFKSSVGSIPELRHVLSFHTKAALGYHVHLCSRTPFVFGDEETVMPQLTKESTRFTEQASSILRALSRVVTSFSDEHDHSTTRKALEEAHCPRNINTTLEKLEHLKVFNSAVYHMLCGALDRELTAEEQFAVLALTADPSLLACGCEEDSPALDAESNLPENWKDGEPSDHEPSDQEVNADATLQAGFKGHSVQEILNAAKPEENLSASKILFDMWPQVESDADKHAVFLLRYIIDHHFERKAQLFPCQQDEWTNTTFVDYSVSLQDTANSWVLIFREVFLVPEEMLLAAKVYSPIPNCLLHVINNDTGEKLDMVLNKLAIHVFQPNKLGYTFVAEAVTPESPPVGAEWRMRLISSREPLPKLTREAPLNTFSVKEFCDYYIPNDDNLICRYSVQVTTDVQGTIQFQTSMQDVLIRLSILDQGKEVASNTGKGHVVIPIYFFLANKANELEEMKSSSTPETPSRKSDTQKNNRKGAKAKGKAAATAKAEARPETVLDLTKPHWTLRVVTDESEAESIEAEKDTERMDQITSIKKAWETVEPGRCAKALQSRLQFLNPVQPQEDAAESTKLAAPKCDADTSLSNEKLTDTSSTCPIMDYTPFIRCQKEFPVLLDTQMEEIQMRERLENIQTYRLVRDNVLEHQKQQELNRKELMRRQPGIYENMQADLWQRCKRFLEACEALSSHPGPGEKKEREEKPALEEDQKAV
ncbi:hypothetical protein F2P81_024200 [Scophthalmus maximus]|uniref:Uncharacterized protein n=1 Tax=Scophthalmus maximus TaxID=52904 RepID=A0A6A4RW24_SCOMX|nr:hypothetical protein F2P81_024200 [Scophthalmus maximus]